MKNNQIVYTFTYANSRHADGIMHACAMQLISHQSTGSSDMTVCSEKWHTTWPQLVISGFPAQI